MAQGYHLTPEAEQMVLFTPDVAVMKLNMQRQKKKSQFSLRCRCTSPSDRREHNHDHQVSFDNNSNRGTKDCTGPTEAPSADLPHDFKAENIHASPAGVAISKAN